MAFCTVCGAQTADGSTLCPACSRSAAPVAHPVTSTTGGMTDNVAGMLAYVTIIPAILFLVIEPYNKNRFVRFHAFQNIFLHVAAVVAWIAFIILSAVLAFIPILGHLVALLLWLTTFCRTFDCLGYAAGQSQSGPNVEAAGDRRYGRETSQRRLIFTVRPPAAASGRFHCSLSNPSLLARRPSQWWSYLLLIPLTLG